MRPWVTKPIDGSPGSKLCPCLEFIESNMATAGVRRRRLDEDISRASICRGDRYRAARLIACASADRRDR
ncbi:hypothetical protein Q1695_006918 [Nippostrongylus brasiliensis]|nr:hypothetical protein Q1695_006918 [Nippostrongylus brasiliensis]